MKVGSLFSGIGGIDLGLERADMEIAWQVENDDFCKRVLAKHWPNVPCYGDIREVKGADLEPIDLICGGFPCQDLSVAGKRTGLDGARSGLWFEFHRILSELRPSVALIENVPGLLSSNQGRDFGVILAGLEQLWPGRWGWAVLDSQHFGVAQRRRRLYVIAGPSRERIAQILSLCESGDWNTQARRAQGEDVAATIRSRSANPGVHYGGRGGEDDTNLVLAHSLRAQANASHRADSDTYIPDIGHQVQTMGVRRLTPVECERLQGFPDGFTCVCGAENEQRNWTKTSAARVPEGTVSGMRSVSGPNRPTSRQRQDDGQQPDEHSDALRAVSREASLGRGKSVSTRGTPTRERQQDRRDGDGGLQPRDAGRGTNEEARYRDLDALPNSETHPHVACKCADGPRYKALGNAVTVPVIEYLGRRIAEANP